MERKRCDSQFHPDGMEAEGAMNARAWLSLPRKDLVRSLVLLSVSVSLAPLVVFSGVSPVGRKTSRASSDLPASTRALSPTASTKLRAARSACPSKSFNEFLKMFANRIEVQDTFTLRPIKAKTPYYWRHNTEPGDPHHPKWLTETSGVEMPDIKYRYDPARKAYVWDEAKLMPGKPWSHLGPDGKARRVAPLPYFKIRKVSGNRYEVDYIRSGTDSFVLVSGCWHFEQHWERESIVDCKWPHECRRNREYESELGSGE